MKTAIIILHGWGLFGDKYSELKKILEEKGYKVFSPDLPGFGNNPLKKEALEFEDYVAFVLSFIKKNKLNKVILIGHSFGGRIAIRFTSLYPKFIEKLILTGASGIPRPLPSLKKKVFFLLTKILRPVFTVPPFSFFYTFFRKCVYYSIGEMDYYKAGDLRETFKNVYKVGINNDLEKIIVPTLIVWGKRDISTPLEDGRLMHTNIKKSKLIISENETHKFPYENPLKFSKIILPFLAE